MADKKNDGYIRWRCKECGQRLKVREDREGGEVMPCPRCGALTNVPLSNIDAIAQATEMEETGMPGRLNVNRDVLKQRLTQEGGVDSMGGAPTLKQDKWSIQAAFGRITELDEILASLRKGEEDFMGQVQRLYRDPDVERDERREDVKKTAQDYRRELLEIFQGRMATMDNRIRSMEAMKHRLGREEMDELARLKRAFEAVRLVAGFGFGVKFERED
jgi:DNA-directed RNA polymerase subunit RPC12/RpoP